MHTTNELTSELSEFLLQIEKFSVAMEIPKLNYGILVAEGSNSLSYVTNRYHQLLVRSKSRNGILHMRSADGKYVAFMVDSPDRMLALSPDFILNDHLEPTYFDSFYQIIDHHLLYQMFSVKRT